MTSAPAAPAATAVMDGSAMDRVVHKAWTESLPNARFDPKVSWSEAGGDSIAGLHLLFRLERALGSPLSFDFLSPDTTPRDLALRLQKDARTAETADAPLPLIFLIPGLYGDEPILAEFRRVFAERLRFDVLPLPELDVALSVLADIKETGRLMAAQISRRAPQGPLMLAGFSFGGDVAHEAAVRLMAEGRRVDLVVVLDGPVTGAVETRWWAAAPRLPPLQRRLDGATARMLIALGCDDARRRLLVKVAARLGRRATLNVRRTLLGHYRREAIRAWRPSTACTRLLLVVSEELGLQTRPRWARIAPHATVVQAPGAHLQLFAPAAMAIIKPAVLSAVNREPF